MSEIDMLIERVKGLSGPDREVDGLIFGWLHNTEPCGTFMCGFDEEKFQFRHPDDPKEGRYRAWYVKGVDLPSYTGSIDAAVALVERVLPGAWYLLGKGKIRAGEPLYGVQIMFGSDEVIGEGEHDASLALAATLALLKAIQAGDGK